MIQVTDAEFDRVVETALAGIPEELRKYLENVVVEVHERPSRKLLEEHEAADDLLGLYAGHPLVEPTLELPAREPDRIYLFKANLCEACDEVDELEEEIRVTVLHEVGHHFGLDEDQLADLGYD
jgi:predicted Zn-dependent protease with MMP-like domain